MAGGVVVNGVATHFPDVYVTPEFANLSSRQSSQGILAVVGSLPFLEKGVAYLSTNQSAFDLLSPRDPLLQRISNIVWDPSDDPRTPGRPAAVYLLSVDDATQAQAYLLDSVAAQTVLIKSKVWGTRGNLVRLNIATNATLGGTDFRASLGGVTLDNFRVAADDNVITLTYLNPYTAAGNVAKGFAGTTGLGSEGTGDVTAAKSGSDITVAFSTSVPEAAIDDTGAANTWLPSGPVNGLLTVVAGAGASLAGGATHLMVEITGTVAGVATVERMRISAADIATPTSHPSTSTWDSISAVKCYPVNGTGTAGVPGTAGTPAGTYGGDVFTFSGRNFPLFNATNGQTYAADVIQYVSAFSTDGFTASTGSPNASTTLVASLDTHTAGSMVGGETLGATAYRLVAAINANSVLVEATQVLQTAVNLTTALVVPLLGGTSSAGVPADYTTGLNELSWFDINTIQALSNDAAIHAIVHTHLDYMSGVGANERNSWFGVAAGEAFAALSARVVALNDFKHSWVIEEADIVQFSGAIERMEPYWYALVLAAQQEGNRGIPLTHKKSRVKAVYRNSNLASREALDACIAAGLCVTTSPPGEGLRLERWVTGYIGSDDPARTEGPAVDSTFDCARAVRNSLRPLIGSSGTIASRGLIEGIVQGTLDQLVQNGQIRSWVTDSLSVVEFADRWEVRFTFSPSYPINFILISPVVSIPTSQAA